MPWLYQIIASFINYHRPKENFCFSPKTVPQNPLIFSSIWRGISCEGIDVVFFPLGLSLNFYVFEENDHNICEGAE